MDPNNPGAERRRKHKGLPEVGLDRKDVSRRPGFSMCILPLPPIVGSEAAEAPSR